MSHTQNERVIFKDDKNGYVVKSESLKKIKQELKGTSISIKKLKDGEVLNGNLYYGWVSDKDFADGLFDLICHTLQDNVDRIPDNWDFYHHPIRFLIKHRN